MTVRTPESYSARQADRRRSAALEGLGAALEEAAALEVPMVVTEIRQLKTGSMPRLGAEAFELARQVYYLQHGSPSAAAHAGIAAGLSETDSHLQVYGRLQTWWDREGWPKRKTRSTFAIRDANYDGGLYRGTLCAAKTTGNASAPKGKPCTQTVLPDSEFCFQHDPRPKYAEIRARQADLLRNGHLADQVPVGPFQKWCRAKQRELLAEARNAGEVHPNDRGKGLLAAAMGIDQSHLGRVMEGRHHRHPGGLDTIGAATVGRYLEPFGLSFVDVYGYEPPTRGNANMVCPRCGGRKEHGSKTCRECYEATEYGTRCKYVTRTGRPCPTSTKHESGVCQKCRRITERIPRPRTGRPSSLTPPRLLLALDEYRRFPSHAHVSNLMWSIDAGDVRSVYANRKGVAGSLVKQFHKRGIHTAQDAQRAYDELAAELGPAVWPCGPGVLGPGGMVPFGPFAQWLAARKDEGPTYKEIGRRTGFNPDNISAWLRGKKPKTMVRYATVELALRRWGDGTTFADVYGVDS